MKIMKWHKMRHFIRVYTVCNSGNKRSSEKEIFYLGMITCNPLMFTMDLPKFIVSNQKEKSIRPK